MGARHSHVEVTVGHLRGSGIAKNKKAAKQEAAKVLLQKLEGDPRFKSAGTTRTGKSVNKQKMTYQMKARFSREVAPNMTLQSEEQEGESPNKEKEKSRNVEVPVALFTPRRSLKDMYERVDRIEDQTKKKAPREDVGAAETSPSDLVETRRSKRPDRIGSEGSKLDTVCASETNNNQPMSEPDMDHDGHKQLVDRVKWRLARMEERQSRGEGTNGELESRIEEVKEKLWRFKYLTWLKQRQMKPSSDPVPQDSRSPLFRSRLAETDLVQLTLQISGYGLADSLEKAVENETGVSIQRMEIKSGRICVVLSGREGAVLKAKALLKKNCQPRPRSDVTGNEEKQAGTTMQFSKNDMQRKKRNMQRKMRRDRIGGECTSLL